MRHRQNINCNNCGSEINYFSYQRRFYRGTKRKLSYENQHTQSFKSIDIQNETMYCKNCGYLEKSILDHLDPKFHSFLLDYFEYAKLRYRIFKKLPLYTIHITLVVFITVIFKLLDSFLVDKFETNLFGNLYIFIYLGFVFGSLLLLLKSTLIKKVTTLKELKNVGKLYKFDLNDEVNKKGLQSILLSDFIAVKVEKLEDFEKKTNDAIRFNENTIILVHVNELKSTQKDYFMFSYNNYVQPQIIYCIVDSINDIGYVKTNSSTSLNKVLNITSLDVIRIF